MIVSTGNKDTYITRMFNHGDEIYSDTTESNGGGGEYFRPHDLIKAGFASCLNITARMVVNSMNLASIFIYQIDIEGQLDEKSKRTVLKKVMNCPVRKTLSKQLEFIDETHIP